MKQIKSFSIFFDQYQVTQYREYQPGSFDTFKEGLLFHCFGKPASFPDELKVFDSNIWIDVQDYDFQLFSLRWIPTNHFDSAVVEDSNASNSRAVKLPGGSNSRATVRLPLTTIAPLLKNTKDGTKYRIFVYARCGKVEQDEIAMICDIGGITKKSIYVSEIAGSEYRKIEFYPVSLNQSMFINFMPSVNEKNQVFIDRVVVIKDELVE